MSEHIEPAFAIATALVLSALWVVGLWRATRL